MSIVPAVPSAPIVISYCVASLTNAIAIPSTPETVFGGPEMP